MWQALRRPQVGLLLVLIFMQQIAFGGFEQLLALFTLNRLGLNASGNAVIFVFVGIVVVAVQGGFIGTWSRKLGDRRLTYMGLITLALGLALTALTPAQPVPWYSRPALVAELTEHNNQPAHTNTYATGAVHVALPSDDHNGWLGLTWILVAMIPAAVGGGVLQPSLNSLITKRVALHEIGGTLGISAAFLSGANALAPLIGGALFQGFGSTAPFLAGAVVLGLLFVAAWQLVGPGREELAQASLNA
jgi:MFS family permease